MLLWFQQILLQSGGKLHVKDIADRIVESGLIPPRSVLWTCALKAIIITYNVYVPPLTPWTWFSHLCMCINYIYIYIYIYLSTTRLQYSKYISNIYTFSLLIKNETIFEKKTKDIYIISIHIFNVKMFFFKCTYTLLVEFNFMVMDLMMSVFRSFYVYQSSRNMVPLALI